MNSARARDLFFDLFSGLPRLGPGDSESTRRALSCIRELSQQSSILEIGCGTGAQTFVLAHSSTANIVAIDCHVPYVEALNKKVAELGVADRIVAYAGDMRQLDFSNESFDLIWCEGAIYNMGVATALRDWRRLLKRDGVIAFTEVCWRKPEPPKACRSFWEKEYPAIRSVEVLLTKVVSCGYEIVDHFPLPESAWWDEYYQALQDKIIAFRERYVDDLEAQGLCDQCQQEIDIWLAYSEFYGYEFLILRPE